MFSLALCLMFEKFSTDVLFLLILYILLLHFTTAKSNADGFYCRSTSTPGLFPNQNSSWDFHFQTVGSKSLWPCLYDLSVLYKTTFPLSKGKTLRLLHNALSTSSQPLFFHICHHLKSLFQHPLNWKRSDKRWQG